MRVKSVATPSTAVSYTYNNASLSGAMLTPASVSVLPSAPNSTDGPLTTYEYDSFGRLFRTTKEMPASTLAITTLDYDALNRKTAVSMWEAASPTHKTLYEYDTFGRAIKITPPDFTALNDTRTTITYSGVSRISRTSNVFTGSAQNAATTSETYDRQGRLASVTEANGTVTNYGYDAGGRLKSVCVNQTTTPCDGQARAFVYDSRGFLSSETHPENGQFTYTYDARGHVLTKGRSDNHFVDMSYTYDKAERLTEVKASDGNGGLRTLKTFHFDAASHNGNGKLDTSTRHNYTTAGDYTVVESFDYNDNDGRLTQKTTTITDPASHVKSIAQSQSYDALNRPASVTYPACSGGCGTPAWATLQNTYDKNQLTAVGLSGAPSAFASLSYGPSGMLTGVTHGNGIVDTYSIDSSTMIPRPSSIAFGSFSSCTKPSITTQPSSTSVTYNTSAVLSVSASGASLSYQWYDADSETPVASGGITASYTTEPITQTRRYYVWVANACGRVKSNIVTVSVAGSLGIPTLTATKVSNSTTQISVTWTTVGSATSYILQRRSNGASFTTIADNYNGTSYTDNVSSNTAYVYRAAAKSGATQGTYSDPDIATTIAFTDAVLTAHVTPVKLVHVNELLIAANAVRACSGLPAVTWSSILQGSPAPPAPATGVKIYAEHIQALRRTIDAARSALQLNAVTYTDTSPGGVVIKATHIDDLRRAVQ